MNINCFSAHGKRSSAPIIDRDESDVQPQQQVDRWALLKFIQDEVNKI